MRPTLAPTRAVLFFPCRKNGDSVGGFSIFFGWGSTWYQKFEPFKISGSWLAMIHKLSFLLIDLVNLVVVCCDPGVTPWWSNSWGLMPQPPESGFVSGDRNKTCTQIASDSPISWDEKFRMSQRWHETGVPPVPPVRLVLVLLGSESLSPKRASDTWRHQWIVPRKSENHCF